MAKISELFPEYARLADELRTGEIQSTPENEASHDKELAKVLAHRETRMPRVSLAQNSWAISPVAAAGGN